MLAVAEIADHFGGLLGIGPQTHRPEIGVAAALDGSMHVHRTVDRVAAEVAVTDANSTRAVHPLPRVDALLEEGQRHGWLDGRSGRVEALGHLVEQWN